jgi:hypothetical protein
MLAEPEPVPEPPPVIDPMILDNEGGLRAPQFGLGD